MTNADVLITILAETTGQPPATFRPALDAARVLEPGHWLDVELSPDEAQELLTRLRAEKAGILNWLIKGRRPF
jgi:hypothetical protein